MWDYLRRSGQGGYFLPLSGGIDSSSSACIVASMCDLVCKAVSAGGLAIVLVLIVSQPSHRHYARCTHNIFTALISVLMLIIVYWIAELIAC